MSKRLVPSRTLIRFIAFPALTFAVTCPEAAEAQEKILEEVIVTSQKRAQSIMDVPISVAAVTGDKIDKAGIESIEDLTAYVPSVHLTETGLSTQLRVRGVGSDNSQGFEQSVGVYKDGVFHGRAQLFRAPIFDVERVEVMRGPQNTLFGKNSVAGALDIITAKPQHEFAGQITASYEAEYGTQELSGFVTGPLTDRLNARIAMRQYNDPGYMENSLKRTDEPDSEETAVRVSFDWQASDRLDLLLTVEHAAFDVQGRAIEITHDSPSLLSPPHPLAGLNYSQIISAFNGGSTFEPQQNFQRQADANEFSENTISSATLIAEYDWNDYTVTSTTGYLAFDYLENCDCDFVPAPIFDLDLVEDYEQISQEIRIASPMGERFDWLAGVFYQSFDQEFTDTLNITDASPLTAILAPTLNPTLASLNLTSAVLANTAPRRAFEQSSTAFAIFAEATWHIDPALRLTVGARYTEEEKDGDKTIEVLDISGQQPTLVTHPLYAPVLGQIYANVFGTDTQQYMGHELHRTRDESAFMPAITVGWDVNDDLMTYIKYSRGFKAGGFDPRSNSNAYFEFEDESVTAMELGSKWVLADGAGELNTALFYSDYEDIQTSQFDGYVGFNVGNADALVRGVELDGRWKLTEHWLASFGMAYLDFEYTDYPDGNCYFGQTPDNGSFCDNTGKTSSYVPHWTFNGTLEYQRPLSDTMNFVSMLDLQWVDEQQVHNNLDPRGMIDPYTLLSLRLGVETDRWALALLGKNLLDEEILTYSSNIPLAETIFATNAYYSFIRRPLTVALEASIKF